MNGGLAGLQTLVLAVIGGFYLLFAGLGGYLIFRVRNEKKEKMTLMDFGGLIISEIAYQILWAGFMIVVFQVSTFAISGGKGAVQDIWYLPGDLISWIIYDVLGVTRHTAPKPGGMLLPAIYQLVQMARIDPTLTLQFAVGSTLVQILFG